MPNYRLEEEYFEWIYDLVCSDRYSKSISYRKLLTYLHNTEFVYTIRKDRNRASDGIGLRDRFVDDKGYNPYVADYIDGPCSVLEMMVALAIRGEESLMDDPMLGNRTAQWFWGMITSLGLGGMYDSLYDERLVEEIVTRFLNREYEPDGRGGLFTVRNAHRDMRDIEIWYQWNDYTNTIL